MASMNFEHMTPKRFLEFIDARPALRINPEDRRALEAAARRKGGKGKPRPGVRYREREEELRIILPFVYPSRNEIEYMNRYQKSAAKRQWLDQVRFWLMVYERREPGRILGVFRSRVRLKAILHLPDPGRRRDLDNYSYKWLKDALVGYLLEDDSARHVEDAPPEFAGLDRRPGPWMEVIITPKQKNGEE